MNNNNMDKNNIEKDNIEKDNIENNKIYKNKDIKYHKVGQNYKKTDALVLTAMFFAVAIVLSIIEGFFPLPTPVPGVKMGLSNIAVMYALFFFRSSSACSIVVLKGIFTAITRGPIAGLLSLSGGLFSIAIMMLLIYIFKDKISYFILSIAGALFHNLGQFAAISVIYTGINMSAYLPVLIIFGIIAGVITSVLLRFILPALQKLGLK